MSKPPATLASFVIVILIMTLTTTTAYGQSFNIDIGPVGSPSPPDSYAGAGHAGHWTTITAQHGVRVFNLVDVNGVATAASVIQVGGSETVLRADRAVAGDDAALMNDCVITHSLVENCLFFDDLLPGTYEVIIYARMPAEPTIDSESFVDEEAGSPRYLVGGEWPGQHELHVSYSVHTAEVTTGDLGFHAGVPTGGDFGVGAALNGFQLRLLGQTPGDVTGDDVVDFADLLLLLSTWGECPPTPCAGDTDGNGFVDFSDLLFVLANWSV